MQLRMGQVKRHLPRPCRVDIRLEVPVIAGTGISAPVNFVHPVQKPPGFLVKHVYEDQGGDRNRDDRVKNGKTDDVNQDLCFYGHGAPHGWVTGWCMHSRSRNRAVKDPGPKDPVRRKNNRNLLMAILTLCPALTGKTMEKYPASGKIGSEAAAGIQLATGRQKKRAECLQP